jgi:hypothetical protein
VSVSKRSSDTLAAIACGENFKSVDEFNMFGDALESTLNGSVSDQVCEYAYQGFRKSSEWLAMQRPFNISHLARFSKNIGILLDNVALAKIPNADATTMVDMDESQKKGFKSLPKLLDTCRLIDNKLSDVQKAVLASQFTDGSEHANSLLMAVQAMQTTYQNGIKLGDAVLENVVSKLVVDYTVRRGADNVTDTCIFRRM